jgi:hypothetical protein
MDANDNIYVPFAQLPSATRFFYLLAMKSAILHLRPILTALQVVVEDVSESRLWDDYKFTPADAAEFFYNSESLEPYLIHCAVKNPNFWCSRLAARRSPRRRRK